MMDLLHALSIVILSISALMMAVYVIMFIYFMNRK